MSSMQSGLAQQVEKEQAQKNARKEVNKKLFYLSPQCSVKQYLFSQTIFINFMMHYSQFIE